MTGWRPCAACWPAVCFGCPGMGGLAARWRVPLARGRWASCCLVSRVAATGCAFVSQPVPAQVLGNKKDLPGALTERELIERMDLQTLAQARCPRPTQPHVPLFLSASRGCTDSCPGCGSALAFGAATHPRPCAHRTARFARTAYLARTWRTLVRCSCTTAPPPRCPCRPHCPCRLPVLSPTVPRADITLEWLTKHAKKSTM